MKARYRLMPHPDLPARAWFDWLLSELSAGRPVRVAAVGTFARATRKARRVRNPATGQLMQLGESTTVQFRAAKAAKARVR